VAHADAGDDWQVRHQLFQRHLARVHRRAVPHRHAKPRRRLLQHVCRHCSHVGALPLEPGEFYSHRLMLLWNLVSLVLGP
jgi:hypothetical protein